MNNKVIYAIGCVLSCLLFTVFPGMSYAGPNSSAGCSLDMDYTTCSYESGVSSLDIESSVTAYIDDIVSVAVIAQGVTNLDTYQVEVLYDTASLQFIGGYEDVPLFAIDNLLKTNGGATIGFQAIEKEPGIVNIANTLTGTDTSQAPEGSGIIAIIRFKVLEDGPSKLILTNVHFVDSLQNDDLITNKTDGELEGASPQLE